MHQVQPGENDSKKKKTSGRNGKIIVIIVQRYRVWSVGLHLQHRVQARDECGENNCHHRWLQRQGPVASIIVTRATVLECLQFVVESLHSPAQVRFRVNAAPSHAYKVFSVCPTRNVIFNYLTIFVTVENVLIILSSILNGNPIEYDYLWII